MPPRQLSAAQGRRPLWYLERNKVQLISDLMCTMNYDRVYEKLSVKETELDEVKQNHDINRWQK